MNQTLIVAEAGVNHNGNIETARQLIQAAAAAGADIVKFQTFRAKDIVVQTAPKATYQKSAGGPEETQLEMLRALELSVSDHTALMDECRSNQIEFLSTAFDRRSVELLAGLGLSYWKVPSGEITNLPYLRTIGATKSKVLLSTGMADLGEIEHALNALETAGTRHEDITVLHCTTEYPTPWAEVNLTAMVSIRDAFKVAVGYSDHTSGVEVAVAAVALGASVIEKHFTLNKALPGPDHKASLEPLELSLMIESIRHIEMCLGDGRKRAMASELAIKPVVRKSIVAASTIKKGDIFTPDNITLKRPADGISPMLWDEVVGSAATRDYSIDERIELR